MPTTISGVPPTLDQIQSFVDAFGTPTMAPVARPGISAFTLLGLTNPVAYIVGLNMTTITQTVTNAGLSYSPIASAIPFTTSGTFETAKFKQVKAAAAFATTPTITGSRGGNVALASLLSALASLGVVVDSTTT